MITTVVSLKQGNVKKTQKLLKQLKLEKNICISSKQPEEF